MRFRFSLFWPVLAAFVAVLAARGFIDSVNFDLSPTPGKCAMLIIGGAAKDSGKGGALLLGTCRMTGSLS
jgi:hypothetical protein